MNNKIYVVIAFILFLSVFSIGIKLFEAKVVKSVILELKREYVPGPFSPGYDPDKIDPILSIPEGENNENSEERTIEKFNSYWR